MSSSAPSRAVYGGGEGGCGTEERNKDGTGDGDGCEGGGDVRSRAEATGKGTAPPQWMSSEGWARDTAPQGSGTLDDCMCIPGPGRFVYPYTDGDGTPTKGGEVSCNEAARAATKGGGERGSAGLGNTDPPKPGTLDKGICIPALGGHWPTTTGKGTLGTTRGCWATGGRNR